MPASMAGRNVQRSTREINPYDCGTELRQTSSRQPTTAPEVKHVKVRSSVDVMAELESLRKKATQTTPKPARKEVSPLDQLLHPKKRDVQKSLTLAVAPGVLPKATRLRVAVSFENESGVVQAQEQVLELNDGADAKTLSVNLKFES